MKRFLAAAALGAAIVGLSGQARADLSITLGEPGFFGRIELGDSPRPVLLYDRPIIIVTGPVRRPPVYLRVPPGHAAHWDRHCRDYDACAVPVYFVADDWYDHTYVPYYREHRRGPPAEHREIRPEERRDDRRDEPGPGHRHGRDGR